MPPYQNYTIGYITILLIKILINLYLIIYIKNDTNIFSMIIACYVIR